MNDHLNAVSKPRERRIETAFRTITTPQESCKFHTFDTAGTDNQPVHTTQWIYTLANDEVVSIITTRNGLFSLMRCSTATCEDYLTAADVMDSLRRIANMRSTVR